MSEGLSVWEVWWKALVGWVPSGRVGGFGLWVYCQCRALSLVVCTASGAAGEELNSRELGDVKILLCFLECVFVPCGGLAMRAGQPAGAGHALDIVFDRGAFRV